jgi:hypothetical protein
LRSRSCRTAASCASLARRSLRVGTGVLISRRAHSWLADDNSSAPRARGRVGVTRQRAASREQSRERRACNSNPFGQQTVCAEYKSRSFIVWSPSTTLPGCRLGPERHLAQTAMQTALRGSGIIYQTINRSAKSDLYRLTKPCSVCQVPF